MLGKLEMDILGFNILANIYEMMMAEQSSENRQSITKIFLCVLCSCIHILHDIMWSTRIMRITNPGSDDNIMQINIGNYSSTNKGYSSLPLISC